MPRADVPLEVAAPHQPLAAHAARVRARARRCAGAGVQPHVLVEVARVAERAQAVAAAQRLVAGVRADVDLEAVLARVELAAVHAHVAAARAPPLGRERLEAGGGVGGGRGGGRQARAQQRQRAAPQRGRVVRAAREEQVQLERVGPLEQRAALVARVASAS